MYYLHYFFQSAILFWKTCCINWWHTLLKEYGHLLKHHCIIDGICCRLMLHFLGGMLHRFAKKLVTFKIKYTYAHTHIYIYIHLCIFNWRFSPASVHRHLFLEQKGDCSCQRGFFERSLISQFNCLEPLVNGFINSALYLRLWQAMLFRWNIWFFTVLFNIQLLIILCNSLAQTVCRPRLNNVKGSTFEAGPLGCPRGRTKAL